MNTGVIFIGAGNIATSLATNISKSGVEVRQVIATSSESAKRLADMVGADHSNSIDDIFSDASLYIIAVPDSQIRAVLHSVCPINQMVAHTSGSTPIEIFDTNKFPNHGVFYPFQTFSKSRIVDLQDVSICIEANTNHGYKTLESLANKLSHKVVEMNSEQRKWLHLTGVFGSNFVNHILALTYQIATSRGINFEIIKPLVEETVKKAFNGNPAEMQTGPAIRNDLETMEKHSEMLMRLNPELQDIYKELSLRIQKLAEPK